MKTLRAYSALLPLAPPRAVAALSGLLVLGGLTEGVGILMLVPLLDSLQGQPGGTTLAHWLWRVLGSLHLPATPLAVLMAFVVLIVLRSAVQWGIDLQRSQVQHAVVDHLRLQCFDALLHVEWRWLITTRRSDHANLLQSEISRVGVGLTYGINLLATGVTMLAYLTAAWVLSWQMTLFAVVSGCVVLAVLSGQRRSAIRLGQQLGQANRALQANLQEALAGLKLTKILGNEASHLHFFQRTVQEVRAQEMAFVSSTSLARSLFQVGGAVLLAVYLAAGLSVWHLAIPPLLTLVLIFGRLIPLFMAGQQQLHHCLHALPCLDDAQSLLKTCQAAREPQAAAPSSLLPPNRPHLTLTNELRLEEVSVRYVGRDQAALDGISLRLPARTTTAIMGASGAGKSTLADVLMGLLVPDAGRLLLDGQTLTAAQRMLWRSSVAYVPQETFLFHDSIRRNLLWGMPAADHATLTAALRRAAADFVFDLPQGIDTVVGDQGVRLSGGERQRIALARALLRQPSLLILDEATSALDLANEARVREAVEHLHGDLTVVIIGHRLSTLEHADQVLILDQGRVIRQGTWQDVSPASAQSAGSNSSSGCAHKAAA